MPNANPPDGATQPDTDADFRHRPHGHDSGKDAPSVSSPSEGPGVGSAAWSDPGAAPVLAGDKPAGGVDADHPHLFHLAEAPANVFDGGCLQGGHEHNWPILKGQQGACYIARLAPGGVREPHWHPYAWEMNFVLQGRVRWTFVGPNSAQDGPFEAEKGDMIFAPQGHFIISRTRAIPRICWSSSFSMRPRWSQTMTSVSSSPSKRCPPTFWPRCSAARSSNSRTFPASSAASLSPARRG